MSKSHVQIPASLLKPFSINKNTYKVYVMNADGLITEESIKKCNTIENYYSDYVESEILANLESQFGEVKNKILVAVKESCNIYLSDKELETLKRFVMITFARNPWFAKQLREGQIFDFGLSIEDYSIVVTNFSYHVFEKHFSDFYLSLFINKTKIRLVIPQNVIFVAPDKRCLLFVLPISPNVAILFGQLRNVDNCFVCKSEDTILRFNEAAVQQELNAPKDKSFKHVYAQDCSELEVAKRYINN